MKLMSCNTCRAIVEVNNTGVCMACQMGFRQISKEEIKKHKLLVKEQETLDAIEKGKKQASDRGKYSYREESGEAQGPSDSNCSVKSEKSQKKR